MRQIIRAKKWFRFDLNGKKIARLISNILIPPFFFLLCIIYLSFIREISGFQMIFIIVFSILVGLIIPVSFVLHSVRQKKISNIDAEFKEERTKPYLLGIILFTASFLILYFYEIEKSIAGFYFAYVLNLVILFAVNRFWKISAHAQGAAISLGLMAFDKSNLFFLLLPFVLAVMWSRYELRVHTIAQIITGCVVGFTSTYLTHQFLNG